MAVMLAYSADIGAFLDWHQQLPLSVGYTAFSELAPSHYSADVGTLQFLLHLTIEFHLAGIYAFILGFFCAKGVKAGHNIIIF